MCLDEVGIYMGGFMGFCVWMRQLYKHTIKIAIIFLAQKKTERFFEVNSMGTVLKKLHKRFTTVTSHKRNGDITVFLSIF